jgi:nondiscriminating glutamyl-tRNA synthetase
MTIIVNNQGKKLSKRDGSIVQFMSQYRNLGYLPEAIMNFILLLGWAPEGTQEIFTLSQAIESFDAARLSSAPSTFDPQKLMWLNNHYIKAMNHEAYLAFIAPFVAHIPDIASWTVAQQQTLALLFKDQIQYGQQIIELASAIVTPKFAADEDTLQFMHAAESTQALAAVIAYLQAQATIDFHTIKTMFKTLQTTTGLKGKALFMPVRIQLTGQLHGAELAMIMPLLGKEETLKRLKHPWTLS